MLKTTHGIVGVLQVSDLEKKIRRITGIVFALAGLLLQVQRIPHLSPTLVRLASAALLIWVVLSWLNDQFSRASRLKSPALLQGLGVESEESLLARQEDVRNLFRITEDWSEIHLVGESGVGRSALLQWGLCPALKRRDLLWPIYMDALGRDWDEAPRRALARACSASATPEQRQKLGPLESIRAEQVLELLSGFRAAVGRTPLLIFDDFDSYLVRYRSRLLSDSRRTWFNPEELVARNEFWRDIAQLLRDGSIHVMFSARSDEADGLNSFRFGSPQVYRLERLPPGAVTALLAKLTDSGLASDPDRGWISLRDRLSEDLKQDGTILPVQMKIILQGLDGLNRLTVREYNRAGRLGGIEAVFIERRLSGAAKASGLSEKQLLRLLIYLVNSQEPSLSAGKCKSIARTLGEIAKWDAAFGNLDSDRRPILQGLEYLAEKEIVRQRIDPDTDEPAWSLYHDYLCRGILAAERRSDRWQVSLRERQKSFLAARGHLLEMWNALLTPITLLTLVVQRLRGKVAFGPQRAFLMLSLLRFAPYVLIVGALYLAADTGRDFPSAGDIRWYIDKHDLSLFRRQHGYPQIASDVRRLELEVLEEISKRHDPVGWIWSGNSPDNVIDYWTHSQAICAALHAPQDADSQFRDLQKTGLGLLFTNGVRIDTDKKYGWKHDSVKSWTRVEPLLWTTAALAAVDSRTQFDAEMQHLGITQEQLYSCGRMV